MARQVEIILKPKDSQRRLTPELLGKIAEAVMAGIQDIVKGAGGGYVSYTGDFKIEAAVNASDDPLSSGGLRFHLAGGTGLAIDHKLQNISGLSAIRIAILKKVAQVFPDNVQINFPS